MAKAKAKARAKTKPRAKPAAKAKPKPAHAKAKKAKAKPAPKPKPKPKRRAGVAKPVRANTRAAPRVVAEPPPASPSAATAPEPAESIAPFTIDETARGYALLLVDFGPHAHAPDGYAWEAVARRVVALSRLRDITYDPEPRMFCAYAPSHAVVSTLARRLADLYHAPDALAGLVAELAATTDA